MMNVRDNKHHHNSNNSNNSSNNRNSSSNNRHHTLPLFDELAAGSKPTKPDKSRNHEAHDGSARANLNRELQRARLQRRRRPVNPHLAAARKLSKDIRRLRDGSQEQTLTGRAICQHLRALLQEAEVPETDQETKLHG